MNVEVVQPAHWEGWNMCLWGDPMFSLRCGKCGCDFKERVPIRLRPRIRCPACGVLNEIPIRPES